MTGGSIRGLEALQKKSLKRVCGTRGKDQKHNEQLRQIHILPLPLFVHWSDIIFLSKLYQEKEHHNIELPDSIEIGNRNTALSKLPKPRTERTKCEFIHRTCRMVNRTECYINLKTTEGLKKRELNFMWKFVNKKYSPNILSSWQLCCDCQHFTISLAIV